MKLDGDGFGAKTIRINRSSSGRTDSRGGYGDNRGGYGGDNRGSYGNNNYGGRGGSFGGFTFRGGERRGDYQNDYTRW